MTTPAKQVARVVEVAQHLTAIVELADGLAAQAESKARDRLMPGGEALAAIAPGANLEAWQYRVDTNLRAAYAQRARLRQAGQDPDKVDLPTIDDWEDDWTPLQLLCYWSERWRRVHDAEYGRRPTLFSEAAFLRWALDWANQNEPEFEVFASDMHTARMRLEAILYAGVRVERGVPCMYDECGGARLVREIDDKGNRTDWRCPRCSREWNEDRYWANVNAANERAQREEIELPDGTLETWCSVDYAARELGRSAKTIRTWVNRGHVATACLLRGRRIRFVNLAQVRARHEQAGQRGTTVA